MTGQEVPGGASRMAGTAVLQTSLDRADEGRGHGHADVKATLDQSDVSRLHRFDDSDALIHFVNGLLGAYLRASAAAVTHLGEDERLGSERNDGVVFAKTAAVAAVVAKGFVHLRNRNADGFRFARGAPEKQVVIRLFHVAVQKQHVGVEHPRQIYRHGCLAGSTLAGGDRENHDVPPKPVILALERARTCAPIGTPAWAAITEHLAFNRKKIL